MRRWFTLCFFLISWGTLRSQGWSPLDSIGLSLRNTPEWSGGLDGRYSYVNGKPVDIFGLRIGADYKKTAAYIGFYTTAFQDKTDKMYQYAYLSAIGEYRWYSDYRWFLAQTVQLGIGMANLTFKQGNGNYDYRDLVIIPLETGVHATYRVWKFIGVSAGVGARFSITPGTYFTASYYTIGVCLYPDEISKTFHEIVDE